MRLNGKSYYNVKFTSIGESRDHERSRDCLRIAANVMFTQMSVNKGIQLFKERAVAAIVKECTQLEYMNVVSPENPDVITPKQKQKPLRAVNLIKDKRCGKINGQTFDDCSTQIGYIPRKYDSSPPIYLEALMDALVVDSYGVHCVLIFDVPETGSR